jgi:hypothetical protein
MSVFHNYRKRYHLAIKFLNMLLKVDFFFFDIGIGRDMLEFKGNVSSELFIGTDRVDGSTSGTGTSGKATGIFFPPTSVADLVIGVVNLIVVIVFVVENKKRKRDYPLSHRHYEI